MRVGVCTSVGSLRWQIERETEKGTRGDTALSSASNNTRVRAGESVPVRVMLGSCMVPCCGAMRDADPVRNASVTSTHVWVCCVAWVCGVRARE